MQIAPNVSNLFEKDYQKRDNSQNNSTHAFYKDVLLFSGNKTKKKKKESAEP